MPKYTYKAVDDSGRYCKGSLEAPSYVQAMDELKARGLWIRKLADPGASIWHKEIKLGGPKAKTEHFTVFCRQLSTLYRSGVPMVESIKLLSRQTESAALRGVLSEMAEDMEGGDQLSEAAARHPTMFASVFVSMVRAGEASGNLDDMLERLAVFYEKEHYTREKVKSAMIYPAVMAVATVLVVTMMLTFVIPRYVSNFESMGIPLPLPTKIVVALSEFIRSYWFFLPVLPLGSSLLLGMAKKTPKGLYYWDLLRIRIPVFGKLAHKQSIARFSRTFSSLHAAAIPMLQTLTIVSTVVGNEALGRLVREAREGLRNGDSVAQPFANSRLFPPMVVQMLAIGERSGSLDSMLDKVADFYEADVDAMAERLKSLLEPLMIVLLSGIVGGIVLAVMLPTFGLMQGLN
ncbi:type II secretion system F family protein [Paenibacillus sp. GYB003]|uniref:type II secretion system F family protein n=1 Tax=Paenibacillus sp. GYB003 TaxID=2994392 RepID=UPI002F96791B